jgi:hypothetical protein
MKARLLTGPLSVLLLFAPLARPQDHAAKEAHRQAQVALKPAGESPSQTMQQAIAFERYKELAAEREARKEAGVSNADRSADTPRPAKATK